MGLMSMVPVYLVFFLVFTGQSMADNTTNTLYGCSPIGRLDAAVFDTNLDTVLDSLSQNVSTSRFGTDIAGNFSNQVYGLAQCRADLSLSLCAQCFEEARNQLARLCPTQNGGRIFVHGCFLRFENSSFFTKYVDNSLPGTCNSSSNSSAENFSQKTQKLLSTIVETAPSNKSFAVAWTVESASSNIYALAECWQSVSTLDCQKCLQRAQEELEKCLPSLEGQDLEDGCYLRYANYSFVSVNGISATNTEGNGGSKGKIAGIIVGVIGGVVLMVAAFFVFRKRSQPRFLRKWRKRDLPDGELELGERAWRFDYEDLREATDDFDVKNKIGEGGFGQVFKGRLQNGREIAVKRLFPSESNRVAEEFVKEIELISGVSHRNLLTLLGFSTLEDTRMLVFDYMTNGSLDKHLFGRGGISLNWEARFDIILGTARGLTYLHEYSHVRIVHRDIKPANILLDDKFQPKIADFGLARLFPHDRTHLTTGIGGTLGYTAPEYAVHGQLTVKADVYSYGVLVLEIVSGRKSIQNQLSAEMRLLLPWTWRLYQKNEGLGIVDPRLEGAFDAEQVSRVINVALLCAHDSASKRPSMSNVVSMLTGNSPIPRVEATKAKPAFTSEIGDTQYVFIDSTSQSASSSAAGPSSSSAAGPSSSSALISGSSELPC
ncbi:hypothetical protein SUGI_0678600 [Cryptomeria japonica]|uniref:cold-responsive protein kinase 1 n=1 Tax=Cryptomeria japonica TaxID=3369 RepID=UPI002414A922|nr:cold-responsive protein kinase 1 [Cryptomeria japonica]GLJ33760.1 hypothetical protein SUGI_0678600 [Cryptomeria japonica]